MTHDELMHAIQAATTGPPARHEAPSPSPQVTVSMPAYNAAAYIRAAMVSVLNQSDVELELIVVDDASRDSTQAVVEATADARVKLLRNPARRGIGHGHNRVIEEARAPVIVHVDADDFILPGALKKAVTTMAAAPGVGQAYANHFEVDESGAISAREFERQRAYLLRVRERASDFRRDLLVHGMVVNPLRTYRKTALQEVGPFNERLKYSVDYEMAVRLAARFDMRLIPEFLYCNRIHSTNTQEQLRLRLLRFWLTRLRIAHQQLQRSSGRFLGRNRLQVYGLNLLGLAHVLELPAAAKAVLRAAGLRARPGTAR
jgi:glycosyltransferase involved in cell wall biosynthesis